MKRENTKIGLYGEDLVCKHYINNGYRILDRNYRGNRGEIDLIGYRNSILVFVEVKTRYNTYYGTPREAVNLSKQKKIKSIAKYYIHLKNLYNINVRFDVVEVFVNYSNNSYNINVIPNAFT